MIIPSVPNYVVSGNIYTLPTEGKCLDMEGSRRPRTLKKMKSMKYNWNVQRDGVGVIEKFPSFIHLYSKIYSPAKGLPSCKTPS